MIHRLTVAAFFVTIAGTVIYGAAVGMIAAGPVGSFLGMAFAGTLCAIPAAFLAAISFAVLGRFFASGRIASASHRRACVALGGVLGSAMALTAFNLIGPPDLDLESNLLLGAGALLEGLFAGAIVWSSASREVDEVPIATSGL